MLWRSVVSIAIWVTGFLLVTYPDFCGYFSLCRNSKFLTIVLLSISFAIISLWDYKVAKKRAREYLNLDRDLSKFRNKN